MEIDNFWSIECLLAEEENMKVEFVKDIKDYGVLTEERKPDAKKGMINSIPFWLARELF